MSTPFLGEIRIISFNFAPQGWAFCNGQFLPINQNQALFSILGTTYGGNGQRTFALPEMPPATPIGKASEHSPTVPDPTGALLAADGRGGRFATTGQTAMAAQ